MTTRRCDALRESCGYLKDAGSGRPREHSPGRRGDRATERAHPPAGGRVESPARWRRVALRPGSLKSEWLAPSPCEPRVNSPTSLRRLAHACRSTRGVKLRSLADPTVGWGPWTSTVSQNWWPASTTPPSTRRRGTMHERHMRFVRGGPSASLFWQDSVEARPATDCFMSGAASRGCWRSSIGISTFTLDPLYLGGQAFSRSGAYL